MNSPKNMDVNGEDYEIVCDNYSNDMLSSMNKMRQGGISCDYTLISENKTFPAHKIVLMSFSDFFYVMLNSDMKEKHEDMLILDTIDAKFLGSILDYAYTGKMHVEKDDLMSVLHAASYLQIPSLLKLLKTVVRKSVTIENCVEFWHHVRLLNFDDVILDFVLEHFSRFMNSEHINELTPEQLKLILCDPRLEVLSELSLLDVVKNWTGTNYAIDFNAPLSIKPDEEPWEIFSDFMSLIRWSLIPHELLKERMHSGIGMVMQNIPRCARFLEEAKFYADNPFQQPLLQDIRTSIRGNHCYVANIAFEYNIELFHYETNEKRQSSKIPLKFPWRYHYKIISVSNFLFVCCCNFTNDIPAFFYRYDPRFDTWLELTAMTTHIHMHFELVHHDNKIYAIGGYDKQCYIRKTYAYDIGSNVWSDMPPGPEMSHHAICVSDDTIYVSGGECNESHLNTMYSYAIKTQTWKQLASMYYERVCHVMTNFGAALYVCHGTRSLGEICNVQDENDVERYCIKSDQWTICKSEPEALASMKADRKAMVNGVGDDRDEKDWVNLDALMKSLQPVLLFLPYTGDDPSDLDNKTDNNRPGGSNTERNYGIGRNYGNVIMI